MGDDAYITFMALLSYPIIEYLAQKQRISIKKALDLFYNSELYRLYEREETKLWHFSNVTLAELLVQEITTGHIDIPVEG